MSKIIKASVWGDPVVIEAPPPPPPPPEKPPEEEKLSTEETMGLVAALQHKRESLEAEIATMRENAIAELAEAKAEAEKEIAEAKAETEKAREAMMAECNAKKKEAEQALSKAKTDSAVMRADAEQETKSILDDAHEQARHIMEDAKKSGHEEGVAEGREEGLRQAREEQKQAILDANTKAEKTLADAKEECRVYVQNAENEIASLAMEIVDHVLPQHFIDVPTIILPLVKTALLKVKDQSEVHVRVAPEAFDLVLMGRSEFQGLLEGQALLEVHSDETLATGDVVIETPNGNVDARLSTQLELIRKSIQDAMK
ncbi:MAG: flagellar assembly protein FliH [Schwartzia sp.]|nr:flagellar assembly protein FliH [Schwartzia sp. (in: firmicutes)]MBR1886532.1 flagellar assembly protein FliH [Schwartzia sp. (in: firmicutes)]